MSGQAAAPDQQVAVITGAGTGIGAAVARRLAAGGAAVVLVGRRPQPLHDPHDVGRLCREVIRRVDRLLA